MNQWSLPFLSWPELHGALTHFPVALLLASAAFEIGARLWRKTEWRIVSFWLLVGAVVMAIPSLLTGWLTGRVLFAGGAQLPAIFVQHWIAALTAFILAAILLLWRIKARDQLKGRALVASLLLIVLAAGAVGYAGYLGGRMVFGAAAPEPEDIAGERESS